MTRINVINADIEVITVDGKDYISLTDMANAKESESRAADIIKNWLRTRYTLEFLGTWELINNPDFKVVEFDNFKSQAGLPSFVMSVSEWIEETNAVGIIVKKGKYGGTYAHKDIAFEFGSAISVPFKLYLIKEFQRLKEEEQKQLGWSAKRELSKINYHIHTDAVKQNLLPEELTPHQIACVYANEADLLNVALFGLTAKPFEMNITSCIPSTFSATFAGGILRFYLLTIKSNPGISFWCLIKTYCFMGNRLRVYTKMRKRCIRVLCEVNKY